jgi:beta-lactamase class A
MRVWRILSPVATLALLASAIPSAQASVVKKTTEQGVQCVSAGGKHDKIAKRIAEGVDAKIAGRSTPIGLNVTDSETGISCWYHPDEHFYAASVMKVAILGSLLRKVQQEHRWLTEKELHEAWLMITQSDNDAADDIWFEVGMPFVQHFLDLAKMKQTVLNKHWGLSLITAHDELLLLQLITGDNDVLDQRSRIYARYLMGHVTESQRWGVPAGAPGDVSVHLKNGWLPYPGDQWEINSIGTFTSTHRAYLIVMLTYDNPSMEYGIDTIERAAEVIHRELNPRKLPAIAPSKPNATWGRPDEPLPGRS